MNIRNFFLDSIAQPGGTVLLEGPEAFHAVKVLRIQAGDMIGLLDGCGIIAEARVAEIEGKRREIAVHCEIVARRQLPVPQPKIHLFIAPPRTKQMSLVIRTAVELGVWRLIPTLCEHSVARPAHVPEHWQAEVVSAMKQSGNPFTMRLAPPQTFADALESMKMPGYFGAVPDETQPHGTAGGSARVGTEDIGLWIGPEGGFSAHENAALRAYELKPLSVGDWILRVETAVPALLGALLFHETHDANP